MSLHVPRAVGETAPLWDEQHLDVESAGQAVGAAPTGGFTSTVASAASGFTSTWQGHCHTLGEAAETRADGLRTALAAYLSSDEASAIDQITMAGLLRERR